ncbi:hypothetical protein BGZ95_006520 [Linnemannia exigua]|uniref:Uncharacterized protein n=1 Tax=Linnemannia exigua TaxID=604196 RepID=A0AAD4DFX0_9FUNG|nr:hypothetical protein BGZ95_006520 [Linnemannia exigua]
MSQKQSPAMIDMMSQSFTEPILHMDQLDLEVVRVIKDQADTLTRLEMDIGQSAKGKRHMYCIFQLLLACTSLRRFMYHNQTQANLFKEVVLVL